METISETFTIGGEKYKLKIKDRNSAMYPYKIYLLKHFVGPIYRSVDNEVTGIDSVGRDVQQLVERSMTDDTEKIKESLEQALDRLAAGHDEIER